MTTEIDKKAEAWTLDYHDDIEDEITRELVHTCSRVAFKAGYAEAQKWIAVSERLPSENRIVLTIVASSDPTPNPIVEAFFRCGIWKPVDYRQQDRPMFPPTHWFDLPQPPKQEAGE